MKQIYKLFCALMYVALLVCLGSFTSATMADEPAYEMSASAGTWLPGEEDAPSIQVGSGMNLSAIAASYGYTYSTPVTGTCQSAAVHRYYHVTVARRGSGSIWRGYMSFYRQDCST